MRPPTMVQALEAADARITELEIERDNLTADLLEAEAVADRLDTELRRGDAELRAQHAYASRLMTFIIDHIGEPYTAEECGHVLELLPLRRDVIPVLCPHGRATAWTGVAEPRMELPAVEHCEQCNPGTSALGGGS